MRERRSLLGPWERRAPSGRHPQGSRVGKQVDVIAAVHLEKESDRRSLHSTATRCPAGTIAPPGPHQPKSPSHPARSSPLRERWGEAGAPASKVAGLTSKRPMRAAAWRARITSVSTHICWTSVDTFSGSGSSWKEAGTMLQSGNGSDHPGLGQQCGWMAVPPLPGELGTIVTAPTLLTCWWFPNAGGAGPHSRKTGSWRNG